MSVEAEEGDVYDRVIVLTQSCDLEHDGLTRVMVCPVYTFREVALKAVPGGSREKLRSLKSDLKKGRRVYYHLLDECELSGHRTPHLVADFGDAFSVPFDYARELASGGDRLRLLPPYREHLAQMFARFYMRIGLPVDVRPIP